MRAADVLQRQAVGLWPDYAEGHNNLGALLLDQGRPQEALDALRAALKLKPDYPEAYLNMGNALRELGSLAEAIDAYRRAIALRPTYAEALAQLVYHRARACDWTDIAVAEETLLSAVRQNAARIPPFMLMPTAATGADQLLCARKWVEHFAVPEQQVFQHHAAPRAGRLRIGYLSSDFYDHATAYLIAELIERHDRDRFEIHGYSYGADPGGAMRARLVSAFDRFTDIDALAHRDAAARIRADDIDILVDLKGHTHRARPKILAFRPAPVQVNYLGYPGTMGAVVHRLHRRRRVHRAARPADAVRRETRLSARLLPAQRHAARDRRRAEPRRIAACRRRVSCSAPSITVSRSRPRSSPSGCGFCNRCRAACCGFWNPMRWCAAISVPRR